jgi:Flp pilus assembly protein TadG
MSKLTSTIRRLVREDSGNELMEAAAIFPLLFMVILAIFWFGQAFSMYGTITRAAQEGARAGAAPYCSTCASSGTGVNTPSQNAYNAVKASLSVAKLNVGNASAPTTTPTFTACTGYSTTCAGDAANMCVQYQVQLNTTASQPVCGIAVSFRYPFSSWLPFTTLNNQQIWLNAQARVRMETQ